MACAEQSEWADPTEKSELTWHGITVRNRVGVMIALGSTTIASMLAQFLLGGNASRRPLI
jgi:hypothetical protein